MVRHGNASETGPVLDQGLKTGDGFDFKIGTPLYYIVPEYGDNEQIVGGTIEIQSTHGCKIAGSSIQLPNGFFGFTMDSDFQEYENAKAQLKRKLKESAKKQFQIVNQILDFLEALK